MNQLPPKTDEVRRCAMSERQRGIYTSILQASREQIGTANIAACAGPMMGSH